MGNIMQKWAKTGHFWNQNSSRTNRQIQFLYYCWKEHELEIQFHTTLTGKKWNKVIILASKLKKWIFMVTSFLSTLNWDYLGYRLSIFSQILICCSWDNSLPAKWHLFLIFMTSSQSNLRLRRQCIIFHICVLYQWEITFFPNRNLHDNVLCPVSRLLFHNFLPNFSML